LAALDGAAATGCPERYTVKEVAGTSKLYFASSVAGKQAVTLARDSGLSIISGDGSAKDFFLGLVPVVGTYRAFQTYRKACGVNGGG
jgi:hypothetical protein